MFAMLSLRPGPHRGTMAPIALLVALLYSTETDARHGELPNRIPEPPPFVTEEARVNPPPWESTWSTQNDTATCAACHTRIHSEWNGSMMANAWRDPAWRSAFLLLARQTATDGNCDVPEPPDGSQRAQLNPFAGGDCTSTFALDSGTHTTSGSGSLIDDFCSRCHMPANYIDQIPLENITVDPAGIEHGQVRAEYDPTSDEGSGTAFATVDALSRNTMAGKNGVQCQACHADVDNRLTPYHGHEQSGDPYTATPEAGSRAEQLPAGERDRLNVPDPASPTLGYAVGAGAFRLSPHALVEGERFGPLTQEDYRSRIDPYLSDIFDLSLTYQRGDFARSAHEGYYDVGFERAEMCGECHDVTNPLTIRNKHGRWVGGFPIERTYSEWSNSRYADRPGNAHFDPDFKRDCQTCHMQQGQGRPGTAQTLYSGNMPAAPIASEVCVGGPEREIFHSHVFVGGNAYLPRIIGAATDAAGKANAYPELSTYSFSSADPDSPYYNAVFTTQDRGPETPHARLAWDRLRNVLMLEVDGPQNATPGTRAPIRVRVTNSGAGHKFPTGFPEGRIAWVAVRAHDLDSGRELEIHDAHWQRTARGVGYLNDRDRVDPAFPGCKWKVPAGAPDPFAYHFRAVATTGDGCPTLDLPYATAPNVVNNGDGLPVDADGRVIDADNPRGIPQFRDLDGDGDVFDDAYLLDTRLRPLPHPEASVDLDRYSVIVPDDIEGPISVTATVYYQSFDALVAKKLLGNLADTDSDGVLEPCVLRGPCDDRIPRTEPAVVEGAPPVPMEVRNLVIGVDGNSDSVPPRVETYPRDGAASAHEDVVIKLFVSEPVTGIDATSFTLTDASGVTVPATVDQIGDFVWGLFPDPVMLEPGQRFTAHLDGSVCDAAEQCLEPLSWQFTVAGANAAAVGNTGTPIGVGVAPHTLLSEIADARALRNIGTYGALDLLQWFLIMTIGGLASLAIKHTRRGAPGCEDEAEA